MKKNLVIDKSFKYNSNIVGLDISDDYIYNEELGYWVNKNNNIPMMLDKNASPPKTKKQDIETGEDRKGE